MPTDQWSYMSPDQRVAAAQAYLGAYATPESISRTLAEADANPTVRASVLRRATAVPTNEGAAAVDTTIARGDGFSRGESAAVGAMGAPLQSASTSGGTAALPPFASPSEGLAAQPTAPTALTAPTPTDTNLPVDPAVAAVMMAPAVAAAAGAYGRRGGASATQQPQTGTAMAPQHERVREGRVTRMEGTDPRLQAPGARFTGPPVPELPAPRVNALPATSAIIRRAILP